MGQGQSRHSKWGGTERGGSWERETDRGWTPREGWVLGPDERDRGGVTERGQVLGETEPQTGEGDYQGWVLGDSASSHTEQCPCGD